ncbi:MAG: hypothetical protein ACRDV7_05480 [Acidimicrobiia bacterium]
MSKRPEFRTPISGDPVIRRRGAASVAMGRTPHEVRDELCSGSSSRA